MSGLRIIQLFSREKLQKENKKIIVTFFFLFLFIPALCQISFGIKGGMNINRLVMTNLPDQFEIDKKSSLSYHAGVFARIKLSEKFSLIPELQFIQKGFKISENYSSSSTETNYKINYLELPLIVAYSPTKLLSIELGPAAGVYLGAKIVTDAGSYKIKSDIYEKLEFGLAGGVRFNFTEKLSATGRYYYGLSHTSDLFLTEDGVNGELSKMYNHNVQFSVYYV